MFMAHEVVEKALKTGMYALIGINSNSENLKTYNLISHARALSSVKPGQLTALPQLATSLSILRLSSLTATHVQHLLLISINQSRPLWQLIVLRRFLN